MVILEHKSIICAGYSAVLHIHACVEEVQFVVSDICSVCRFVVIVIKLMCLLQALLALLDKKGQRSKQRPRLNLSLAYVEAICV